MLGIIVKGDAVLGGFVPKKSSDSTKVLGKLQESIQKNALFHVCPNVDHLRIFCLLPHVIDAMRVESLDERRRYTLEHVGYLRVSNMIESATR